MAKRYPGRDIVTSAATAHRIAFEQSLPQLGSAELRCLNPVERHGIGLADPVVGGRPHAFQLNARCRRCGPCREHRRRLWGARAVHEINASRRTWFGTLTVRPTDRFRMMLEADLTGSRGTSSLKDNVRYGLLASRVGKDVTKMFKRLRSGGARFRYLVVYEAHKDGWPHVHLLVHEVHDPIRERVLQAEWPVGFSKWRLVDSDLRAAWYIAKYLTKDALARVRASQHYGQAGAIGLLTERIDAASVVFNARGFPGKPTMINDENPQSGKTTKNNDNTPC